MKMKSFNERFNVKTTVKFTGCAVPFRTTLMIINGLFILIAIGLIGLSVYGYIHFHTVGQIISTDIPTGLLLVALLMLALSLIGFIGTLRNNRCLLMIYFFVLICLLIAQTVVAFVSHKSGTGLPEVLSEAWVKEYQNEGQENLNFFQAAFCCCGFNNSMNYPVYNCTNATTISYKSADASSNLTCGHSMPATGWPGCGSSIQSSFSTPMKIITGVSFTVAGLELLAVLFTLILFFCISCCSWEEEEIDPYRDTQYDSAPLIDEYRQSHHQHHRG